MCVLSINVLIRKKSGNLFNELCMSGDYVGVTLAQSCVVPNIFRSKCTKTGSLIFNVALTHQDSILDVYTSSRLVKAPLKFFFWYSVKLHSFFFFLCPPRLTIKMENKNKNITDEYVEDALAQFCLSPKFSRSKNIKIKFIIFIYFYFCKLALSCLDCCLDVYTSSLHNINYSNMHAS